uniref:NYN domain-containing protein n=1 Tax=Panagrolaimus sp. JU765 TaxID=591449 RepID=A0AC34RCK5_9BILA
MFEFGVSGSEISRFTMPKEEERCVDWLALNGAIFSVKYKDDPLIAEYRFVDLISFLGSNVAASNFTLQCCVPMIMRFEDCWTKFLSNVQKIEFCGYFTARQIYSISHLHLRNLTEVVLVDFQLRLRDDRGEANISHFLSGMNKVRRITVDARLTTKTAFDANLRFLIYQANGQKRFDSIFLVATGDPRIVDLPVFVESIERILGKDARCIILSDDEVSENCAKYLVENNFDFDNCYSYDGVTYALFKLMDNRYNFCFGLRKPLANEDKMNQIRKHLYSDIPAAYNPISPSTLPVASPLMPSNRSLNQSWKSLNSPRPFDTKKLENGRGSRKSTRNGRQRRDRERDRRSNRGQRHSNRTERKQNRRSSRERSLSLTRSC